MWLVCIRFPKDVKEKNFVNKLKSIIREEESNEDAVKYYLYTLSDIKWSDYEKDLDYAELIDDIFEGLNQPPLEGAAQIFFTEETKNRILEVEKKLS